jgi:hypothetical protein
MKPFEKGQRVKLTHTIKTALMASSRCRRDWNKRLGIVSRCNSYSVIVVWDGCKSAESLPVKAVEVVGER